MGHADRLTAGTVGGSVEGSERRQALPSMCRVVDSCILRHRGAHRPTRRAVGQPPPPQVRRHMGRGHHRGEAAAGRCAHEVPSGHGRRHSHFGRRTTTWLGEDFRCLAVGRGSLEPVEKHLHFGRLCVIAGRCQFLLGCSTHRPAGAGLPHPFALGSLPRSDNRRTTPGSPGV